jgi:predicted HTH domain antitoxin
MAASLYHARKISFATAASLANLTFEAFLFRLEEHFGRGFIIEDESVLEDMATVDAMQSASS